MNRADPPPVDNPEEFPFSDPRELLRRPWSSEPYITIVESTVLGVVCAGCLTVMADDTMIAPADRQPCPHCHALLRRRVTRVVRRRERVYETRTLKNLRRTPSKRTLFEGRGGEVVQADGTVASMERFIDREHDLYEEKVTRADGTVLTTAEPLSQHVKHGAARRDRRRKDGSDGD